MQYWLDEYIIELTEEADKALLTIQADIAEAEAYQRSIIELTVKDVIRFIMLIKNTMLISFLF